MSDNEKFTVPSDIVDLLLELTQKIREAFAQRQGNSFEVIEKQLLDLNEEIAFVATMADEEVFGKSLGEKEPVFRFENILAHLQMIAKSLRQLVEVFKNLVRFGDLLLDSEVDQILILLERHERVLRAIGGFVCFGDLDKLKVVSDECRELADSCLNITNSYEVCLKKGTCISKSASMLLTVFGRIHTLFRREVETLAFLAG